MSLFNKARVLIALLLGLSLFVVADYAMVVRYKQKVSNAVQQKMA